MIPRMSMGFFPSKASYYISTPIPNSALNLSQELAITEYYHIVGRNPPYLWAFNYYWAKGGGFKPLSNVLCLMSMGLLLVAWLREE